MMDERLKELEKQYKNVPIPKELDAIVEASLKKGQRKRKRTSKWLWGSVAAAAFLTASLNVSPTMARNLADIPVLGNVVQILTFVNYELEEDTYTASITVPKINGESSDIAALNEKYAAEGKALYEQFTAKMENLEKSEGGYLSLDGGYFVLTDTDQILSIGRYIVSTAASSSTEMKYDTIDKQKEIVITLPSLFKDNRYISIITESIMEQMRQEMKATNLEKVYWIHDAGLPEDALFDPFTSIKPDQNFYITEEGKLVIVFDEYEVAPGYMGIVEFEIPTEVLADVLVSNEYIQNN